MHDVAMLTEALVYGNSMDSSGDVGIWLWNVVAVVDSNRATNSGTDGVFFDLGATGRATRNRFENNGDSIVSAGITFVPFLTSSPSGVPAAPRALPRVASAATPTATPTRPALAPALRARSAALLERPEQDMAARQHAALRRPQNVATPPAEPRGVRVPSRTPGRGVASRGRLVRLEYQIGPEDESRMVVARWR